MRIRWYGQSAFRLQGEKTVVIDPFGDFREQAWTIRSTAGTFDDVVAIASKHDDVAGTRRGPNSVFCLTLDGLRLCHLGDFGSRHSGPSSVRALPRPARCSCAYPSSVASCSSSACHRGSTRVRPFGIQPAER